VVLAYDLGGTKVAVGAVNAKGKVLHSLRVPVLLDEGKDAVLRQLGDLGQEILDRFPEIRRVGMASAGPLDPGRGLLLDPTNFARNDVRWGEVPIVKILERRLKRKVLLENDAAAAILAEHWVGAAKGVDNAMILTLGTGLGTGAICNGELVRSGRWLHPEGGHLILKVDDPTAVCGCGNQGCAEAYLSGNGFARRARILLENPKVDGPSLAALARGESTGTGVPRERALALFREYGELLAVAIHNYVMIYSPERVVLTGSFAQASDLFLPDAERL